MKIPWLILLTAASASAAVANGVSAASPEPAPPQGSRLGNAIERDLSRADAEAAKRKRALDLREQAAKAAEARMQAADAQQQQQQAAANAGPGGAQQPAPDAQYDDLARIYQAMKPAKAAVVFEQLALDVQLKVAQRMRERSTALILASMTPKGAAALTMAMARGSAGKPTPAKPAR